MPVAARISDPELREQVIDMWIEAWGRSGWEDIADCPSNPKLPGLPIIRQANCVAEMALAVASLIEASYEELD